MSMGEAYDLYIPGQDAQTGVASEKAKSLPSIRFPPPKREFEGPRANEFTHDACHRDG
jgi:hypothetical protein